MRHYVTATWVGRKIGESHKNDGWTILEKWLFIHFPTIASLLSLFLSSGTMIDWSQNGPPAFQ